MKASDLIARLNVLVAENGDLNVGMEDQGSEYYKSFDSVGLRKRHIKLWPADEEELGEVFFGIAEGLVVYDEWAEQVDEN